MSSFLTAHQHNIGYAGGEKRRERKGRKGREENLVITYNSHACIIPFAFITYVLAIAFVYGRRYFLSSLLSVKRSEHTAFQLTVCLCNTVR